MRTLEQTVHDQIYNNYTRRVLIKVILSGLPKYKRRGRSQKEKSKESDRRNNEWRRFQKDKCIYLYGAF